MKILVLVSDLCVSGGTQKTTLKTCVGLNSLGHSVQVLAACINKKECYPEIMKKVKIFSLSSDKSIKIVKNVFSSNSFFCVIIKIIVFGYLLNTKYVKYNYILTEDSVGVFSLFFLIRQRKRIVWYLNNQFSESTLNIFKSRISNSSFGVLNQFKITILSILRRVYLKSFSRIDYFVVYDKANKYKLNSIGYRNVRVILPGIDVIGCQKPIKNDQKPLNLISVGTMAPYRRYEDVISALKIVMLKKPSLVNKLTIVGRTDSNKGYYSYLYNMSTKSGLKEKIDFIFYLSTDKLEKIYKESDVFIFVNNENTWGLAVGEAIMRCLPTIMTNNIGISEILNNRMVYKVEPNSPNQIAKAILNIYKRPKIAQQKTMFGRNRLRSLLGWDRYVNNISKLLFN